MYIIVISFLFTNQILATKSPQYFYNEKQLRDEAAAEVAQQQGINNDSHTQNTGIRKRKALNAGKNLLPSHLFSAFVLFPS
jgi:hypothetical protein